MNSKRITGIGVIVVLATSLFGLSACYNQPNKVESISTVEGVESLDLPTIPSEDDFEAALSKPNGIRIAKVGDDWLYRNTYSTSSYGGSGEDTITVNVWQGQDIIQVRFDCRDYAVLIRHDVDSDDEAYMTYGDYQQYAYILHIPAD